MTREKTLCYITCSYFAKRDYADEESLIKALTKRGITVKRCVWTDPSFDFSSCSAAIIRTPWDYHLTSQQFLTWLKDTSSKITIHNDVDTVVKNTHKGYLRQLELLSIPIVPTEFVAKNSTLESVFDIIEKRGWEEAVFKPVVGASAYGLCRLKMGQRKGKTITLIKALLKENEGMVQPFQASVQTKGELSLIFFNNTYSHAVVKVPESGDYRVQGGPKEAFTASPACIDVATRALHAMSSKKLLYARIDLLFGTGEDEYLITEVELIEPELFFRFAPTSAVDQFSDAVITCMAEACASNTPDTTTARDTPACSTTPDEVEKVKNKRALHDESTKTKTRNTRKKTSKETESPYLR